MCLAVPGKVLEIDEENPMRMAKVDFGGIVRDASLAYVPGAQVGDYVIVHAGFAISQMDEEEALETFKLLEEIGVVELDEGAGSQVDSP